MVGVPAVVWRWGVRGEHPRPRGDHGVHKVWMSYIKRYGYMDRGHGSIFKNNYMYTCTCMHGSTKFKVYLN